MPSRSASQLMVSRVGRVLPRSIWLTYSFENREPASSVCVIPAATRSWRRRSPRRRPFCAAEVRWCCEAEVLDIGGVDILHTTSNGGPQHPPKTSCSQGKQSEAEYN